jgi:REP element-mobilizing transposase RayT
MPDHIHFILGINDGLTQKLGCIIRGIKMATTVKINDKNKHPIWQRNYFEMIIRNESDFNRIAKYIINNPIKYGAHDNAPVQKNL